MKRIFCLLVALMMLFVFVSCGAASKNEAMDMVAKPGEMFAPDRDDGGVFDAYYSKGESAGGVMEAPSDSQNGFEEKLIVTVRLHAESTTFDDSLLTARLAEYVAEMTTDTELLKQYTLKSSPVNFYYH